MTDIRFDDRVAIVTGAGGGLGREHALLLASRGARVVVNDLGGATDGTGASAGPAEQTVKEIEDLGGVAVADASSVATVEGGQAIVDTALEAFGRVDVVISNAGILRDKAFHNMTPELLDPVLDVHLKGAFHVIRPAWVKMREAGYGRVLVTASNAGILGNFGQTNYGAAKMGLVGLARVLAHEGARYNIECMSSSLGRRSPGERPNRGRWLRKGQHR
jgi:NAD(P)-dependent dehydrogenase (short-subunit alcohol dehydrogenase family)